MWQGSGKTDVENILVKWMDSLVHVISCVMFSHCDVSHVLSVCCASQICWLLFLLLR